MKIVKIMDYDNEKGVNFKDAHELAKRKGCRLLTPEEWLGLSKKTVFDLLSYRPLWLEGKNSLAVLGCGFGVGRRDSDCFIYPDNRGGVVGTPIGSTEKAR